MAINNQLFGRDAGHLSGVVLCACRPRHMDARLGFPARLQGIDSRWVRVAVADAPNQLGIPHVACGIARIRSLRKTGSL